MSSIVLRLAQRRYGGLDAARCIDRPAEIVILLGGVVAGMSEQRLCNPHVSRVMDRELGRDQLAKQMGIDGAAESTPRYLADALGDLLAAEGAAVAAKPQQAGIGTPSALWFARPLQKDRPPNPKIPGDHRGELRRQR